MNFKSRLKAVPALQSMNAGIKAAIVKRRYADTVDKYARMPGEQPFSELLRQRLTGRGHCLRSQKDMKIYFLGTDEQQDRSGILQALQKLADLVYFVQADGQYGQNGPLPMLDRRRRNSERLLQHLSDLAGSGWVPNILIAQTWACLIEPEVLGKIKEIYGTIVLNVSMDDRHQYWGDRFEKGWGGTYPLIPYLDLALTAAPEAAAWYAKEGCPALFFPEASDPSIFHSSSKEKRHDISFVGACYGVRKKIVEALQSQGFQVSVYGAGWPSGRLDTENVPTLFSESKIILGVGTIGHCTDFYALKMRDFDAPMCGSLYLTHDNPDLARVYDVGNEVLVYRNIPDCIQKAAFYLRNDELRESIAQRGWKRARAEHTWEVRFRSVLDTLVTHAAMLAEI